MIYLYTSGFILALNYTLIVVLRNKRDNLNLTTYAGKLERDKLNKTIDLLTGFWLYKLLNKK